MLRPVISLLAVIWRHCSGSWARDRPDSFTERTGVLCAAHCERSTLVSPVQSGSSGLDANRGSLAPVL
jgi:hypothetical protein